MVDGQLLVLSCMCIFLLSNNKIKVLTETAQPGLKTYNLKDVLLIGYRHV